MIIQWAVLFVIALGSVGLGSLFLSALAPGVLDERPAPLALAGLAGLFVAAMVALVANFLAPVTWHLAAVLLGVGLVCLGYNFRRIDRLQWIALAAGSLVLAVMASVQHEGYDGGLYHLPIQLWIVEEKVVFGLANLHGRYGFNSLNEMLLVLGWLPGDDLVVARLMAGLYGLFFVLLTLDFGRSTAEYPDLQFLSVFLGAFFGFNWAAVSIPMGWTNTDNPAAVAALASIITAYASLRRGDRNLLVVSFFLAAFSILLKTSIFVVALVPFGVAVLMARRAGWSRIPFWRIAAISIVFLPWMARSFVMSGCLAYPAAITCLPVPWNAADHAVEDAQWIIAWARAPNTGLVHLAGWDWIPIWFEANKRSLVVVVIAAVAGIGLALALPRQVLARVPRDGALLISVWAVLACAMWFFSAPAVRFGTAQLMILAAVPGLWAAVIARRGWGTERIAWRPTAFIALGLIVAVALPGNRPGIRNLSLAFGPLRIAPVAFRTEDGIRRPSSGDRCFVTPRPCSTDGTTLTAEIGSYRIFYPELSRAEGTGTNG